MDEIIIEDGGFRRRRAYLTSAEYGREELVIIDEVRNRMGMHWQCVQGMVLSIADVNAANELINDARKPSKPGPGW